MNNIFSNGLLFWAGFSLVLMVFLLVKVERLQQHYQRLMAVKKGNLEQLLEQILANLKREKDQRQQLEIDVKNLRDQQKAYLGRLGLVKFNPFSETGGKQSFILAILNDLKRGILLTSFHTRTGSRIYAKMVGDKGSGKDLTSEEKLAVKEALGKKQ